MTRCYEFYCVHISNPSFCAEKSDRIVDYINEYIDFMQRHSVKFDRTSNDKALFVRLQDSYGSEREVTQDLKHETQHVAQPILPIQTPIQEMPQIKPSSPNLNGKSCPVCPEPVDMGTIFHCKICNQDYTIIHIEEGKHRFERITVG